MTNLYAPPSHILLRRRTDAIDDKDLAFLERALTRQLRELAEIYDMPPPGVSLVTPGTSLGAEAVGIDFADQDGVEWAVAHHGWSDAAQLPWSLVGVKEAWSWTQAASHEAIEIFLNMRLDRWVTDPGGLRWPYEAADAVESFAYSVKVEMFGESRDVKLSDYVTPAFWKAEGKYPWDFLGYLDAPFTVAPGGYALVETGGRQVLLGGSTRRQRPRTASRVGRLRT